MCCFADDSAAPYWPQNKLEMESIAYGTLLVGLGINFVLQSTSLITLLIAVLFILFLVSLLIFLYKGNEVREDGQ